MSERRLPLDPTFLGVQTRTPQEIGDLLEDDGVLHDAITGGDLERTIGPDVEDPEPELLGEAEDYGTDPDGDFSEAAEDPSPFDGPPADAKTESTRRLIPEVEVVRLTSSFDVRAVPRVATVRADTSGHGRKLAAALRSRRAHLLAIAGTIVRHQTAWLTAMFDGTSPEKASKDLRPMTQEIIREATGLSKDAVARLVNSSAVVLDRPGQPQFPLAYFVVRAKALDVRRDVLVQHLLRLRDGGVLGPAAAVRALVEEGVLAKSAATKSTRSYIAQILKEEGLGSINLGPESGR